MKVLVIGATGLTGKLLVQQLLDRGDEVTAFARNPADVTLKHERLRTTKGDARDLASLEAAVAGQDAVLAAFGPRSLSKDDLQETFDRNLLAAMKKGGVKRLVNLSAWGAGDSRQHSNLIFKIALNTLLRNVFADKDRGEALVIASDLDFTNVRPGQLVNEPARGGVKASLDPAGLKPKMTRADLATFMIEQIASDAWVRKSPLIGY